MCVCLRLGVCVWRGVGEAEAGDSLCARSFTTCVPPPARLPIECAPARPPPPSRQTRGWFYTLMVLSTALFNKPAFKNLVCNGLVLASDGKKMSKRLKNYPVGGVFAYVLRARVERGGWVSSMHWWSGWLAGWLAGQPTGPTRGWGRGSATREAHTTPAVTAATIAGPAGSGEQVWR